MANKTYLDKTGLTYFWGKVKNLVNSNTTPTGSIEMFGGANAPSGWLICDGSAVSRTTYASLFSIIGTTYGTGDGSTTFNLPNFKGKVPVGLDANDTDFDTLGETGGNKALQKHTHTYSETYWDGYKYGNGNLNNVRNANRTQTTSVAGTGAEENATNGNLQPYIVLNYIIKY